MPHYVHQEHNIPVDVHRSKDNGASKQKVVSARPTSGQSGTPPTSR